MQSSSNRSIVIISGLLTLLILSGGALALGFHNGWLRAGSGAATPEAAGAVSQPADAAVYQQKLDEAYRSLDDAYAQIRVLQAPQVRLASSDDSDERGTDHDDDDDRRERRSRRHDSDDH